MTDDGDSINALLRTADRALDGAEYLPPDERAGVAMNRAYYASYPGARSAVLTEGEEPSTHPGILTRFSYHFVPTGRSSEEVGGILARDEIDRNRADYDGFSTFSPETASDLTDT